MIAFSSSWSEELGEAIKKAVQDLSPQGFNMWIRDPEEYALVAKAWNQGIDSCLEALTESSFSDDSGRFVIHQDEVHILVRRLMLMNEVKAFDLASAICFVLDIELV